MVSRNQLILASQFNTLQNRVAQLLGSGFDDFGYGQSVSSSLVEPPSGGAELDADDITVNQINNLRSDLAKIYKHQNGSNLPIGQFTSNDVIGADRSATQVTTADDPSNPGEYIYTYTNEDPNKGINDIISFVSDAEVDRFTVASGQFEIVSAIVDQRNTSWNNQIVSEFNVSFSNENARRYFFNAGGQIIFEGSVDIATSQGDSLQRDQGWQDMLENVGEVRFNYNSTFQQSGVSTTGVSFPDGLIGNYDLTSSYQTIFKKDANSGDYENSYWTIEARESSSSTVSFRVTLVDAGPESNPDQGDPGSIPGGIQEPVTANLQLEYSYLRANGEIIAPTPGFSLSNSFE